MSLCFDARILGFAPVKFLRTVFPLTVSSLLLTFVCELPANAKNAMFLSTVPAHSFAIQNFNGDDVLIAQNGNSAGEEIADQVIAVWTSMVQPDDTSKENLSNSTDDDNQSSDDDDDSDS